MDTPVASFDPAPNLRNPEEGARGRLEKIGDGGSDDADDDDIEEDEEDDDTDGIEAAGVNPNVAGAMVAEVDEEEDEDEEPNAAERGRGLLPNAEGREGVMNPPNAFDGEEVEEEEELEDAPNGVPDPPKAEVPKADPAPNVEVPDVPNVEVLVPPNAVVPKVAPDPKVEGEEEGEEVDDSPNLIVPGLIPPLAPNTALGAEAADDEENEEGDDAEFIPEANPKAGTVVASSMSKKTIKQIKFNKIANKINNQFTRVYFNFMNDTATT